MNAPNEKPPLQFYNSRTTRNYTLERRFTMSDNSRDAEKIRRVRKFLVRRGEDAYDGLMALCHKSKNMYNFTLHQLLYVFKANYPCANETPEGNLSFLGKEFREAVKAKVYEKKDENGNVLRKTYYDLSEFDFYTVCKEIHQFDYYNLPVTAARSAIKLAYKNVKSYQEAMRRYIKNRTGMTGCPAFPRYLEREKGVIAVCFDPKFNRMDGSIVVGRENVRIPKAYDSVERPHEIKQVRIVPKTDLNAVSVELVYSRDRDVMVQDGEGVSMGIDIGMKNLCAIATTDGDAFLVKGDKLIEINEYANRKIGELQRNYELAGIKTGKKRKFILLKRENKLESEMHKISKRIIEYAVSHGVKHIYIGHNNGWKQKCQMKGESKRKFIQIPYNNLITQIVYKADAVGMTAEVVNEAYTSKCSAVDGEKVGVHVEYSGLRSKENVKEFITSNGMLINADINAALNILRIGMKREAGICFDRAFNPWTMDVNEFSKSA